MQNMTAQFPEMFSGNSEQMKDLFAKMNNVFGKTFEPLLKLVNPGKEKQNVEATIALMDKVTEFSVKQRDIIYLAKTDLQTTTKKRCKTEWHIKKTKREIEKLYKHLAELEEKLDELTCKEDDQSKFLEAALDFKESNV